jgi:hypothetical protein
LSEAHWKQRVLGGSVGDLSRDWMQAVVLTSHGAVLCPQTFGVPPPPQVSGAVQVPQEMVPPQPSGAVPQVCPAGQVVALMQSHDVPAPLHDVPVGQEPHWMGGPPQPSGAVPQI